jgi:hypothetical protein
MIQGARWIPSFTSSRVESRVGSYVEPRWSSLSWRWPLDDEPHGAAELGRRAGVVTEHEERAVGVARETGEPHGIRLGEHGRAIEHDEGEGAAAEHHVGAPCAALRVVRADHPHPLGVAQVHPVARVERALRVDVGHPAALGHHGFHDCARDGCLSTPRRADQLAEPAARQPASLQRGIERHDPGRDRGRDGRRWREKPNELGEGKRHARGYFEEVRKSGSQEVGRSEGQEAEGQEIRSQEATAALPTSPCPHILTSSHPDLLVH